MNSEFWIVAGACVCLIAMEPWGSCSSLRIPSAIFNVVIWLHKHKPTLTVSPGVLGTCRETWAENRENKIHTETFWYQTFILLHRHHWKTETLWCLSLSVHCHCCTRSKSQFRSDILQFSLLVSHTRCS